MTYDPDDTGTPVCVMVLASHGPLTEVRCQLCGVVHEGTSTPEWYVKAHFKKRWQSNGPAEHSTLLALLGLW
jgi:hypothetical protein